jgi:hypothetical protein
VTFQRLRAAVEDDFALALIAEVVKDLQSERAALHADDANREANKSALPPH